MSRRKAKARIMRRFGIVWTHSPKYQRILERRHYPPGQHGRSARQPKLSEYGKRFIEKQKLKAIYDISERQMKRYMAEAARRKGVTGEALLQQLELRLDNIVYRLGFSPTIWGARQLVSHGHILVNGRKVDRPSYQLKPNQVVSLAPRLRNNVHVLSSLEARRPEMIPPYLSLDRDAMTGTLLYVPKREEIPISTDEVNEQLVVEFYSR